MSSSNQNPSYLRYIKARLQPLKRPAFWGSVAGLSLALFFAWQYWKDPETFEANWSKFVASLDNPTTEPSLSSQELAARMADIDSSELLLEEFDRANLLPVTAQPNKDSRGKNSGKNSGGLAPSSTSQQTGANSGQELTNSPLLGISQQNQNASNPLGLSASGLSNIGSVGGSSLLTSPQAANKGGSSTTAGLAPDPLLGFNSLSYFNTNQSPLPTSALQEALNRVATAKSSTPNNSSAQAPAEVQSQALPSSSTPSSLAPPPATILGGSPYNAGGQPNYPSATMPGLPNYNAAGQPNYSPAPLPGTSGYNAAYPTTPTAPSNSYNYLVPPPAATGGVAPVTPGNFGQYPSQAPNPTYGVPNTGYNSTPGNAGFQQNPPAFSVPGRIPGRTLGGGRIGTFSNPTKTD